MLTIIDGLDGTGKTMLVKEYIEKGNYIQIPTTRGSEFSTFPDDPARITANYCIEKMIEWIKSDKQYIMDRGPISDIVYRVFDKYKSVITLQTITEMLNTFPGFRVIWAINDKNFYERGDDSEIAVNRHEEIKKVYELIMPYIAESMFDWEEKLKEETPYQITIDDLINEEEK
jgi:thymidylate kinase